jgi:hypothetical protein
MQLRPELLPPVLDEARVARLADLAAQRGANPGQWEDEAPAMRLSPSSPDEACLPDTVELYASAYRPVVREEKAEIDIWAQRCALAEPLPTMPLRLTGDLFVPVEFELAYLETCRRRRLL